MASNEKTYAPICALSPGYFGKTIIPFLIKANVPNLLLLSVIMNFFSFYMY